MIVRHQTKSLDFLFGFKQKKIKPVFPALFELQSYAKDWSLKMQKNWHFQNLQHILSCIFPRILVNHFMSCKIANKRPSLLHEVLLEEAYCHFNHKYFEKNTCTVRLEWILTYNMAYFSLFSLHVYILIWVPQ